MAKTLLVTGASRPIGREICRHLSSRGFQIHGVDDRLPLFLSEPDSAAPWNPALLDRETPGVRHYEFDLRNREGMQELIDTVRPDAIIHAAVRPFAYSALSVRVDDYDYAMTGTLNLLEAARVRCPDSPFIFLSSYHVYGDRPAMVSLRETATRWIFAEPGYAEGIGEEVSLDHSTHGLFGAAVAGADLMVQEYGRSFFLPTCCLRLGEVMMSPLPERDVADIFGPIIEAHLIDKGYPIATAAGKNLRDFIAVEDVARLIEAILQRPGRADVYNVGGGPTCTCSIREAIALVTRLMGRTIHEIDIPKPKGPVPPCYYSNLRKVRHAYPEWEPLKTLEEMVQALIGEWRTILGK